MRAHIQQELAQAATITTSLVDVPREWVVHNPSTTLLMAALETELRQTRNRVLLLLSFLYEAATILKARHTLMGMDYGAIDPAQLAYAIELVDTQLPTEDKAAVLALLEPMSPAQRWDRFNRQGFPQTSRTAMQWVWALADGLAVNQFGTVMTDWTQACALYVLGDLRDSNGSDSGNSSSDIVLRRCQDPAPLIRKTALWAWSRLQTDVAKGGNSEMLSTIEKVIILKTVSVFAQTPDAVLAEVAELLEEVALDADAVVFRQGDPGDSLYLIVRGKVQVEDSDRVLRQMGAREVFGEMALLDNEPRSASVRTIEPSQLLRLAQITFYELLADRPEIATGIIRVLMGYIRDLNHRLVAAEANQPRSVQAT